jgi:Restriction alleviation protein Lar
MSEVLKPCPHCGSEAIDGYHEAYSVDSSYDYIGCSNQSACGSQIPYSRRSGPRYAIAAWNQRVVDHPVTSNPVADSEVGVADRQAVQVTQADRGAAANFVLNDPEFFVNIGQRQNWCDACLTGECDNEPIVQAFARHRTASAPVATEAMVERVADVVAIAEGAGV